MGSSPGLIAQHRRDTRVRRLRVACATFGASALVLIGLSYVAEWRGHPELTRLSPVGRPVGFVALGASALAVWLVGRAGRARRPDLALDRMTIAIGIGGSAIIAAIEMARPWANTHHVMGVSMMALWLLLVPVLSPLEPRITLAWALFASFLGPLASIVAGALGISQPGPAVVVYFWLPSVLTAGVAALSAYAMRDARREARVLGPYRLIERLAEGGMGEVWRAQHRLLDRPAAVKLIKLSAEQVTGREVLLQRFEREAQITARLTSPHAVVLHDFGIADDGTVYYVMELLQGLTLQALVQREGALPPARAAHFIIQACHALDEAHRMGLIHRDLKPANIFVTRAGADEDVVKVLDFGLSRPVLRTAVSELTQTGKVLGTPGYIAPEAALDRVDEVDARTDIYALGCVLYLLLTGEEVFESRSPAELLRDHAFTTPLPPSARTRQAIPEALDAVVMQCLAKDRDGRPASCAVLAAALKAAVPAWTDADAHNAWRRMPKAVLTATQDGAAGTPTETQARA